MMNLRFIKNVSAYSRPIDNLSFYSFQLSSLIIKKQHYIVHYLQVFTGIKQARQIMTPDYSSINYLGMSKLNVI